MVERSTDLTLEERLKVVRGVVTSYDEIYGFDTKDEGYQCRLNEALDRFATISGESGLKAVDFMQWRLDEEKVRCE